MRRSLDARSRSKDAQFNGNWWRQRMSIVPVEMRIELLGPLSVRVNDVPIMPDAPKPRQVIALLALNSGHVVTVGTLMEELWGDQPPRSARTTLQTYVLDCRRRLAAATGHRQDPKRILRRRHNGYLLDAGAAHTDVRDFEQLARSGRAAVERDDHP